MTTTFKSLTECQVLIVENEPMIQIGLSRQLANHDIKVVEVVEDGHSAVAKTFELQPNIVLMDIGLPGINGIEATRQIKSVLPNIRVIILTCNTDKKQVFAAFASGADAYCVKGINIEQLQAAITAVINGSVYLDGKISNYILKNNKQPFPSEEILKQFDLTQREIDVLKLMAQGKNNSEIGKELYLSINTIKGHVRQIFAKLAVNDRVNAALKAWQIGLVTQAD